MDHHREKSPERWSILKTVCGFSPAEIARAFLTTEAAIAKRLTRAKQKIREAQIPFEIPAGEQLERRLDGVLQSAVAAIRNRERLDSYYLLYAVLGEFEAQLNDPLAAAGYFRRSLQLAQIKSEQDFLSKRFQACEAKIQ